MGARTYIPTLVRILERVCKFVVRYRPQINVALSPEQETMLDNVVTACTVLVAAIGALPRGD